ncbi:MAG: EpsG family protein [Muribaculaceae bacterium]|nr:EpsG family protein [Muribaculaceae bacterium]MDE6753221.1 EpsG family protein [Muribaculaceae bacterium]
MIYYAIPLILSLIGVNSFEFKHTSSKKRYLLWIVICVYMILLIGLRFEVGGDTLSYMGDYQWRPSLSEWELNFLDKYQPGYTLLCAVGKSLSNEFYVFQLIHATIFNVLLFYFIKKYTRYIFAAFISVFLCCYLYFATEVLREVLAVMVFTINYESFKEGKWLKYYLGVVLAMFFHVSAVFLLFLPLLRNLRFNRNYFLILLGLSFFLFLSRNILTAISSFPLFMGKIDSYINSTSTGFLSDFLNLLRYFFLPFCFAIVLKFFIHREVKFENMLAILCLVGLASYFNYIIFGRLSNYFILFFAISIVDFCVPALKSRRKMIRQFGALFTVVYFALFASQFIMYKRYTRWMPYYSIFNPVSVNRDNYGDK